MARAVLGVRGMKSREAAAKVQATLALDGVERVAAGMEARGAEEKATLVLSRDLKTKVDARHPFFFPLSPPC